MLLCVCSVMVHRWRQNVVKTKKWHTSNRRVCHLRFFLLWSITEQTHGNIESICFILWPEKKKKTDTHNFLVPLDCPTICAKVPNASFRLCFFSFSLSHLYTVSSKSFSTSFRVQIKIMAKHFAKQRVSRSNDTRWKLLWRFLVVYASSGTQELFLSPFLHFSSF